MTDADRFHIPPQIEAARYVDYMRGGQVLDLRPLIEHFEKELQLERDRVAVERTAASSAREALAACEARLAELSKPRIDDRALLQREREEMRHATAGYVQQIKNLEKRAQRAEDKLGKANCERDAALERVVAADAARLAALGEANRYAAERGNALAELERERARFDRSLSELRSSATEQTVSLVPGSVPAVIESYRLLAGHEPRFASTLSRQWWDGEMLQDANLDEATDRLLRWLDEHAPGGKP